MEPYRVKKYTGEGFSVEVPASKSILARALPLAAFLEGDTLLLAKKFGEDTRTMCAALEALGIEVGQTAEGLLVRGKRELKSGVSLDVGSAGTVARFLTAMLAFRGGDYTFTASEQLKRRPMGLLSALEGAGVRFEYGEEPEKFPFRMHSEGLCGRNGLRVEAQTSTQYASGLMLAAATGTSPFQIGLEACGRDSYLRMTADVIAAFGGKCERCGDTFTVSPIQTKPNIFFVEPDVSAACYFYAAALLLQTRVLIKGMPNRSIQGDVRFPDFLAKRGLRFQATDEGILCDGRGVSSFEGFCGDVSPFSNQALTIAALAPFASTPTRICGIKHIRGQECDRVKAAVDALEALGVPCRASEDELEIFPAPVHGAVINSYGDHRVAMSFALVGLRTGQVAIREPDCCKKTFDDYFEILSAITA